MAIVQISRITHRKGLLVDLPQPLAGGELGWALDERRLFIGNGELSEGAPVIGNTEILTEFSDVLELSPYIYQGMAAGYPVQTGPSPGEPVKQTIQARLDSYAVATDFGIVGNGDTDNTAAINRALFQLYCVDKNPAIRRSLFFPAGVYIICDTLVIPPYATLYGEGTGGTTILFRVQQWTDNTPWDAGILVFNEGKYYRSQDQVPVNIDIDDTDFWIEESMPEYIWRTGDSNQQTGLNIGTNNANTPADVSIIDIEFATNVLLMNGGLLEDIDQATLTGVSFTGPMTKEDITDFAENTVKTATEIVAGLEYVIVSVGSTNFVAIGASSNTIGVRFTATGPGTGSGTAAIQQPDNVALQWASTEALVSQNVKIDNCNFSGFWSATKTDQEIKNIVISRSKFDTLHTGIYIGGDEPVRGGPTGFRVLQSIFDNIYWNGIFIQNCRLNATGYNTFLDVGNKFNGYTDPRTPVIDILTNDNISVGDLFQRSDSNNIWTNDVRIRIQDTRSIAFDGTERLLLGSYQRATGIKANLASMSSNITLFTVNAELNRAINMEYTITQELGNVVNTRAGTLTVISSTNGGNSITVNDNYFENAPLGVVIGAKESNSVVSILYSTSISNAKISYSVTRLA